MKNRRTYRKFVAILLLSVYLVTSFKVFFPYITYQLNYKYFSTVLCENKDKPKMQCHGKCQLNKNLKKSAEEESKKHSTLPGLQMEELPSEKPYYSAPLFHLLNEVSYTSYSEQYLSMALNHSTPPPKA